MSNTTDANRPEFFEAHGGFLQNDKICKSCNMGQKFSYVEGEIKLHGTNPEDPNMQLRIYMCPRCGHIELTSLNSQELKAAFKNV